MNEKIDLALNIFSNHVFEILIIIWLVRIDAAIRKQTEWLQDDDEIENIGNN